MDAYSSSSKYDADTWIHGCALLMSPTHFSCLSFLGSLFTFPPFSSTNSEEAKSTTWLHPVTGEAVITGHRKTPGKRSENVLFCENTRTRAAPGRGCPRVTVEKKGDKLRREPRKTMSGDLFSLQQSNSSSAPLPLCAPLADHYAPPTSCSLHLDTLRHTF